MHQVRFDDAQALLTQQHDIELYHLLVSSKAHGHLLMKLIVIIEIGNDPHQVTSSFVERAEHAVMPAGMSLYFCQAFPNLPQKWSHS